MAGTYLVCEAGGPDVKGHEAGAPDGKGLGVPCAGLHGQSARAGVGVWKRQQGAPTHTHAQARTHTPNHTRTAATEAGGSRQRCRRVEILPRLPNGVPPQALDHHHS